MFTFLLAIFRGEGEKNVYDQENTAYNMLNERNFVSQCNASHISIDT